MSPSLFLVAGEVSGDIYGADLAGSLRRRRPDLDLVGVGGPRMAAAGVRLLFDSTEWGVIGWLEVLPRVPLFLLRLGAVARAVASTRPAAVVLIDFPGFNLPLAARLGGRYPAAYFMPPMVSTRRGGRARRVARLGMRLLAAFPFEAEAYREAGADVDFIGHPALDRVRTSADPPTIRARWGLPPESPVVALLPGSRRQELRRHLPVMMEALSLVQQDHPALRAALPVAAPAFRSMVEREIAASPVPVAMTEGGEQESYDALAASDFAVVASGTATLEAMCLGTPMVVIYRLSRTTWWIATRIVAAVSTAALPSLLAGRPLVPELLQDAFTARGLAATVSEWLGDAGRRAALRQELLALRSRLGEGGAIDRAAEEILRLARLSGPEGSRPIQHGLSRHPGDGTEG
ncbi:MAG: lipid-A-disaccharide synthase [Armatimonadetes bacterium]|nr:lipid-A-disaccharide synthase [Armatimonadota bacterium]